MNMRLLIPVLLLLLQIGNAQEKLEFFQTNWGNKLSWGDFCERVKTDGYDGIEVWLPGTVEEKAQLKAALKTHGLQIGLLCGTDKTLAFKESLKSFERQLDTLLKWRPRYINCHTGSDFFTRAQNTQFINIANKKAKESGIPIYHETHRGRFSYNLPSTAEYVKEIPELKLTLDISHWMVVHESLLKDQHEALTPIIANSHHIHARVGHAEGPQVNDPEAPEWHDALQRHLDIWEQLIRFKWKAGITSFTITTEFGPPDYLPTLPYTQIPVADQWKANLFIMNALKARLNAE